MDDGPCKTAGMKGGFVLSLDLRIHDRWQRFPSVIPMKLIPIKEAGSSNRGLVNISSGNGRGRGVYEWISEYIFYVASSRVRFQSVIKSK